MSVVWNKISNLAAEFEHRFQSSGHALEDTHVKNYNWYNSIYSNLRYRRAHVEIVDHRESHKIYILHCTIFPHFNDPSPIWGFDAVCGPNKITGAFHDFSSVGDPDHKMIKWFEQESKKLNWKRERALPEWAQAIFSPAMVAAGNINEESELNALCDIGIRSLDYYLENVGIETKINSDFRKEQNRYCHYQKQNPHVINSMVSMGIDRQDMTKFVHEVLFPEAA